MKTLLFLGAGASAADGAPIQGAVFREYLRSIETTTDTLLSRGTQWSPRTALPQFLSSFFGIRSRDADLGAIDFPTFEEAIGVLEIARARSESFGQLSYRIGNYPTNYPTLEQMRFILVQVLASAIKGDGTRSRGVYLKLCHQLKARNLLEDLVFATSNYDTLLEEALSPAVIDYGFNIDPFSTRTQHLRLLKIHGSLDWLYCQSCFTVARESDSAGVGIQCPECEDFMVPLIVPPTFFKEMENPLLASIWRSFRRTLTAVRHVIFCGYSFPDADLHIKYAFKHREIVARKNPLRISVVNEHSGKTVNARDEELARFTRFFKGDVEFTSHSFEGFAADPTVLL